MDLRSEGRILYISSVDVSVGDGPGVNEREFVLGLYAAIQDRAHFLIPRPVEEAADLPVGACTFTFPHRAHNPFLFPFHVLSQILLAHKLLLRRNFDLIVFRLDILPIAPFAITRQHRVPYVLKTLGQGMINVLNERLGWLGKALARLNLWLVGKLLGGALLADSVSVAQVEFLQGLFGADSSKIVWIDNAVNTDRFYPSSSAQAKTELDLAGFDPIVGYVGTLAWERGGMQLVETAPGLLHKFPNLGIVILGDGNETGTLKKKALELGVAEHCVFTGYVPFHKVPLYINSLDVGVAISLRPDRYRASELKVRQYLACGKPVVLSPGSNDFVAVEHFGSVVQPTDLASITSALGQWLSLTASQRNDFSSKAAQYMRDNLSIDAAIARRLELWSDQLQAHQSPSIPS